MILGLRYSLIDNIYYSAGHYTSPGVDRWVTEFYCNEQSMWMFLTVDHHLILHSATLLVSFVNRR